MDNVLTALILDIRRPKKNGKFPLKLRITFLRKQQYYYTGIDLSEEEWEKVNSPKARNEYKEIKLKTNAILSEVETIINSLKTFSFDKFEKLFLRVSEDKKDVFQSFEHYISSLSSQGRAGTASSYGSALNSLKKFKSKLSFEEADVHFLHKYEKWMLNAGNSMTTIGIYLRSLRTIFNIALEEGTIKREEYPFGKRKYQIPAGKNIKKSLTFSEIEKIYNYEPEKADAIAKGEKKAKDFWLLSYLCNGMNMKDIARLKYKNIQDSKIVFYRAKTERTKKSDSKPIVVILTDEIETIIARWGNKPKTQDKYIFPILEEGISAEREMELVRQFVKTTNKWMQKIAEKLGIDKKVTTYVARHSFSTILKRSGASVEFIQESLGHTDKKTTESYLDSFEDEIKVEFAKVLTAFKKEPLQSQ